MEIDRKTADVLARRYVTLANQFRADAPKQAPVNFFHGPIHPIEPGLLELQNATVLAGEWFVTAGGIAHCDAFVQTPLPPLSAYLVGRTADEAVLMAEPAVELPIRRCFLLGGCANYCHWLLDYLPRLQFYRADCGPLLINGPLQVFQAQALTYVGIKMSDVMPLEYPRAYTVNELFYPRTASTVSTPYLTFQPTIIDWLRDKFNGLRVAGRGQRKLFISRAGRLQIARRLLNEDEIVSLAREQGFEIVQCEKLSFQEQVTLFSEASVIVGAHGAGLTNLIFAPRTAKIVEMIGPRFDRPQADRPGWDRFTSVIYMKLASILGQNYIRLVGQPDDSIPVLMNHLPYETFTIEPAEFLAAMRD